MKTILNCNKCGKYTMKDICDCGGKAMTRKPAKFNIDDKYSNYRRMAKAEIYKKEGLI
jgi:H/ACA ribonucleoprotein complex subunit 3